MIAQGSKAGSTLQPTGRVAGQASAADQEDGHDHEAELMLGTNRADEIRTGGGPQRILPGNGDDTVWAGGGPDIVEAGNGDDTVYGQGGPDTVFGENGDDYLHGGGGPDVLDGGRGDDILIGCVAADTLTGGPGDDVFVYRAANEAPAHGAEGEDHDDGEHDGGEHDGGGGGGEDGDGCGGEEGGGQETIADFGIGADLIDFSAIGTVAVFADGPEEAAVWAVQQGEDTMLYVDTDGSLSGEHPAEMSILLLGVDAATLSEADFVF